MKADKERARVCRAEKVVAEKAATVARASVEELVARLTEAKKNLAVETAKLEGADSALRAIKTKLAELGAERNRLKKLVDTQIPGNEKDDAAAVAIPEKLVVDALRAVEKCLVTAKP